MNTSMFVRQANRFNTRMPPSTFVVCPEAVTDNSSIVLGSPCSPSVPTYSAVAQDIDVENTSLQEYDYQRE
jgi:hypothetical protein